MRLSKLDLIAYGHFRGVSLDFSRPGIHVVLGRNEAGKSTTLRAITGLLYGIEPKTLDAHAMKFADLRIGGVLERAGGERLRVVRRKGNTNTLLDEREQVLDERILEAMLGGVSKETFVHAFGLDHDTLEAGAKALLEGRGDLGETLFDASVGGGGDVQRLLAELVGEADKIYKPRATSLPLNDALKSFAEAQKSVREKQSLPEAFTEQMRGLDEAAVERSARATRKKDLETKRARLLRALRRVPLERARDRSLARRAELGSVTGQLARVFALESRFAVYQRTVNELRALVGETERLSERAAEAARRAGIEPDRDIATLQSETRSEARIHTLLAERTALGERVEAAQTEIARLEREQARLATPGASSALSPIDPRPLALALERARALGDVESRLATERSRADRRAVELARRAAMIGLFAGSLDELVALRLPAVVSVERLDERAEEVGKALARLAERKNDLEREAVSIERQTATHAGDFAPPEPEALRRARETRDDTWRALRASSAAGDRRAIELEVEQLIREADSLADRMIREADRVTALARLRSEAETNTRQRERVSSDEERARRELVTLRAELDALFADAGIVPVGFAEMSQWLETQLQIVDAHRTLDEARATLAEEEMRARASRDELAVALSASGEVEVPTSLADLVTVAARRLTEVEALRRDRGDAERALATLRAKLDERAAGSARDEAALSAVREKLRGLLAPLGIRDDASAEEVSRSVESFRELFAARGRSADAEARARGARAEATAFEEDVARAIAELAPDLASLPVRDGAPILFSRAAEAKTNAAELSSLEAQIEKEGVVELDGEELALLADPDAAARVDEDLSAQIDELEREIARLGERIGSLRAGLEQMRGESHAADAASAAQIQLARVREHAERWCRVKLASVLLAREIERYREENQAPLLASSSALFSRLTLGAFAGIKAGFDEKDRPCLRCIRADGGAEVDVVGLSDGTRDQLYLALRLASLLRRADFAEPMPLVLDDVLIQLDDQRAGAAMSVLAEIARRMQVLFFTHHARLVDIARAAVPDSELVVHELAAAARPDLRLATL